MLDCTELQFDVVCRKVDLSALATAFLSFAFGVLAQFRLSFNRRLTGKLRLRAALRSFITASRSPFRLLVVTTFDRVK